MNSPLYSALPARFSALQRAENSSMRQNETPTAKQPGFSALQRAENSSMVGVVIVPSCECEVSVLFSEPKIPQFGRRCARHRTRFKVSVLFSEPKIPQLRTNVATRRSSIPFQCSSASRKFLNINRSAGTDGIA